MFLKKAFKKALKKAYSKVFKKASKKVCSEVFSALFPPCWRWEAKKISSFPRLQKSASLPWRKPRTTIRNICILTAESIKTAQTKAEMPGDFLCAFPLCFSCPLKSAVYRPGIPPAAHKQGPIHTSNNSFSGGSAAGKSPDSRAAPEASKPQARMAYPA